MEYNRNSSIARFVRERRKEAGLTQPIFADMAGVSLSFLRAVEQGKPNLQLEKLNVLLSFFGHELAPVPSNKVRQQEDEDQTQALN